MQKYESVDQPKPDSSKFDLSLVELAVRVVVVGALVLWILLCHATIASLKTTRDNLVRQLAEIGLDNNTLKRQVDNQYLDITQLEKELEQQRQASVGFVLNDEDPEERVGYVGPTPLPDVFGAAVPRSGKWRKVRDDYFREHPQCAFAGCKCKGPFNVHHLVPFHLDPSKELDPDNLVTVCAGGTDDEGHESPNHHLWVCHQGDFKDFNPRAKTDLAHGRFPDKGHEAFVKWETQRAKRSEASKTVLAP